MQRQILLTYTGMIGRVLKNIGTNLLVVARVNRKKMMKKRIARIKRRERKGRRKRKIKRRRKKNKKKNLNINLKNLIRRREQFKILRHQ